MNSSSSGSDGSAASAASDPRSFLLRRLREYRTVRELEASDFFRRARREIEAVLTSPEVIMFSGAKPRLRSFLRAAQWNIEKGKELAAVLEHIESSEILKCADLLLLNEADVGMNRSRNRHIAWEVARALGMNMAFGAAHFELTRGTADDLEFPGENCESVQGNAVLSRYPILEARIVRLPVCFEPYEYVEKRYGGRNCVWARLQLPGGTLWAGSVHLEVRNTPRCRAAQMAHVVTHLPGGEHAYLLGGDLNCNTFRRGTSLRTLQSALRLVTLLPARLQDELRHPEVSREPLFAIAKRAGFHWEGFNSDDDTACSALAGLEDAALLPKPLVRYMRKHLSPHKGQLRFKLDWMMGKGIDGLKPDEVRDASTGIVSLAPGCIRTGRVGPARVSDHSPIYADLRIE